MDTLNQEIIYFLPDSDAGVAAIVRNLVKYRKNNNIVYKVIFYHQKGRKKNRIKDNYNVDKQIHFEFSPKENLFAVFNRLKKQISSEKSILVANDIMALRLVSGLKLKNPLVYILHGDFDYYYMLAKQYQNIIDKYITYSIFNYETLKSKLSTKNSKKVELLYYPVPNIKAFNKQTNSILQIVFVGSLIERKGVQYFKPIVDKLIEFKISFKFQIIGSGEQQEILKEQFKYYKNVIFKGQLSNTNVLNILKLSDIFMFPSLSEGLPNVVVEAMKCKCVPIAFNIPSGIPDLIKDNITGYKINLYDVNSFAKHIAKLDRDRKQLNQIAENAYKESSMLFNEKQAFKYERIILSCISKSNKIFKQNSLGRALNKPYLPNFFVKFVRYFIKHPKL